MSPSNGDCNFQIICQIINSFTPLGKEFNNAYLDTSFASIDPKVMELRPIEGTYPGSWNCNKPYLLETFKPRWSLAISY